jgi:hypothetical protein
MAATVTTRPEWIEYFLILLGRKPAAELPELGLSDERTLHTYVAYVTALFDLAVAYEFGDEVDLRKIDAFVGKIRDDLSDGPQPDPATAVEIIARAIDHGRRAPARVDQVGMVRMATICRVLSRKDLPDPRLVEMLMEAGRRVEAG